MGDGILTVLVEYGGATESISKRIQTVLKKLRVTFFPEGGHPVEGLKSCVTFEAKNARGKPADVEGRIVDNLGNLVARFRSHEGAPR